MSVSLQLLALPLTEALVMGLLAGLVGALALLDRRIFLTESLTHSTFPGAVAGVVAGVATSPGARKSTPLNSRHISCWRFPGWWL